MGSNKNTFMDAHEDSNHSIWVHSDNEDGDDRIIEIIEKNGKETIKINGKEMTRAAFESIKKEGGTHEKHIKIRKSKGDSERNVFIIKDSDEDINIQIDSDNDGLHKIFINSDDEDSPLIIIDGKKAKKETMKKLSSSDIKSINVYKGEKAKEKYGKKGKDGVVEIKTKKN